MKCANVEAIRGWLIGACLLVLLVNRGIPVLYCILGRVLCHTGIVLDLAPASIVRAKKGVPYSKVRQRPSCYRALQYGTGSNPGNYKSMLSHPITLTNERTGNPRRRCRLRYNLPHGVSNHFVWRKWLFQHSRKVR